ncbi:MAG: ECF transporter S component [Actinomycetia bacterium]|nr:ECF transporter S component [Actinomycetes bacterium]
MTSSAPTGPSLLLPDRRQTRPWHRVCAVLGGLLVIGMYIAIVLARPVDGTQGLAAGASGWIWAGYVLAALLLLAGTLPGLSAAVLVLIPVALVLNILLGQFVGSTLVPFYLDSVGTVLVGLLAGRRAGAATGVLSSLVWSLFNPTLLPFASVAGMIGLFAGVAGRWGAVRRLWSAPVMGLLTGIISGMLSAPIAAFVYGGTTGATTGAIVSAFTAYGDSLLSAVTKQALISDPADKAITFLAAALLLRALPPRVLRRYPLGRGPGAPRRTRTGDR